MAKEYKDRPEENNKVEEPAAPYGINQESRKKKDSPYPWCPSAEQLTKEVEKEMEDYYKGVPGYTLDEVLKEIKKR